MLLSQLSSSADLKYHLFSPSIQTKSDTIIGGVFLSRSIFASLRILKINKREKKNLINFPTTMNLTSIRPNYQNLTDEIFQNKIIFILQFQHVTVGSWAQPPIYTEELLSEYFSVKQISTEKGHGSVLGFTRTK